MGTGPGSGGARAEGFHVDLLFYGAGLPLLEGARLRVQDVDFGANLIIVRNGKGPRIGSATRRARPAAVGRGKPIAVSMKASTALRRWTTPPLGRPRKPKGRLVSTRVALLRARTARSSIQEEAGMTTFGVVSAFSAMVVIEVLLGAVVLTAAIMP